MDQRPTSRILALGILLVLGLFLACGIWGLSAEVFPSTAAAKARPFGIDRRVPLTTSRVVGSPDPPLPYRAVRAFPKLSFNAPVYLTAEPGGDRLLLVELGGKIRAFANRADVAKTEPFGEVADHDLYAITFHRDYVKNGFVYAFANGPRSASKKLNRIFRYTVGREPPRRWDPKSQQLVIEWASNGHNGGDLAFGPDGCLYITSGDGTSDSDGDVTGQDLRDLCSGVLRIDVDRPEPGKGYAVPKDNPFLGLKDARPELWAFGFRNPWRMAFDPKTGDLWVGDVGQDLWELVQRVQRGGNYGWSVYEGSRPFQLQRQRGPGPILPPVVEHPHSEARSITGGVVYAGPRFRELHGAYVYGDYSTGKIWGMRYANGKVAWRRELADTTLQIVGFGQDRAGEIYIVDHVGQIHRLEPAPPDPKAPPFPRTLSETGLFLSEKDHRPQPGLIPYSVNAPLWSDGAHKERFIALPGETVIDFKAEGAWQFPEAAVLVKTFALDLEPGNPASRRRIETRLLTLQQNEWVGYSYRWNDAQTDADLVAASGADQDFVIKGARSPGGTRRQTWHYPSRAECMVCHSRAAAYVLGLTTLQMNKVHDYGTVSDNQLRTLEHVGVLRVNLRELVQPIDEAKGPGPALSLDPFRALQHLLGAKRWNGLVAELERQPRYTHRLPRRPADYPRLVDPADASADLNLRARSYLHANCAQCHVVAGGGNSAIDLHFATAKENLRLFDVKPLHDQFGLAGGRLLAPGAPERSVLYHRVATLGRGRMPPLSSSVVDEQGARLLNEWIKQSKMDPAPRSRQRP